MNLLLGFGILIVGIFAGIILGKTFAKLRQSKINKKILVNAQKVVDGEIENKCEIDGQTFNATKFKVRNKDNKEEIITFGEGGLTKKLVQDKIHSQKETQSKVPKKIKKKDKSTKKSKK